jgi:4-amino-4-deoxy-L-arabinose transferase-like glycosyltransferase
MPTSRKVLCAVYAAIAVAALIATWSQNLAYFNSITDFVPGLGSFVSDTRGTPASRSITVDILFFFLAAAILMVIEARKHGVKFVWAYILGGGLIAISVTFPLFLIARELRLRASDTRELPIVDAALLAILSVLMVGFAIWVDAGR